MKAYVCALIVLGATPALGQEAPLYLDTALKAGYEIKSNTGFLISRDVDGATTPFTRLEIIVQKGRVFQICAIETNLLTKVPAEQACSTFK